MKIYSFLLFVFILFSCDENQEIDIPNSENLLIGAWTSPTYNGEEMTFKRTSSLPNEDYGILFKIDGSLTERSSGFCGTPPLVFSDYNGQWTQENNLITISQEFHATAYAWRIISLTQERLVVKRELTEQELDHQDLMTLYNDIIILRTPLKCENSEDWNFTPYGAKACGGPQGYLAYPKSVETAFLEKVKIYTAAEKAYNLKWGIFSTCDLPQSPTNVKCQNGYPVLNFN